MQQRQPRLGDILDDYCPRERRLTNHAVVAMIGDAVRLTRCTTCDSEHDYKQAKIPRQRKKTDSATLPTPVAAAAPKRVVHETPHAAEPTAALAAQASSVSDARGDAGPGVAPGVGPHVGPAVGPHVGPADDRAEGFVEGSAPEPAEDGPVHRQLIRAQLPRQEGQPAAPRQAPDFTIRQPVGRQNRFRPQPRRGGQVFQGPSARAQDHQAGRQSNGNGNGAGNSRGGAQRQSGRPPMTSRPAGRPGGGGRNRPK